jgi:hypothetical protein
LSNAIGLKKAIPDPSFSDFFGLLDGRRKLADDYSVFKVVLI